MYFKELESLRTSNDLYNKWIDHLLKLEKDDIYYIIDNGLSYQAGAINSMCREIMANQPVDKKLIKKLDLLMKATKIQANKLR